MSDLHSYWSLLIITYPWLECGRSPTLMHPNELNLTARHRRSSNHHIFVMLLVDSKQSTLTTHFVLDTMKEWFGRSEFWLFLFLWDGCVELLHSISQVNEVFCFKPYWSNFLCAISELHFSTISDSVKDCSDS